MSSLVLKDSRGHILTSKQCLNCGKEIIGIYSKRFCDGKCNANYRLEQKFVGQTTGYDYIICPVCNNKREEITLRHVKTHGFTTIKEFKKFYNLKSAKCQKLRDRWSGQNNPGFQHGGAMSAWSTKSPHYTVEKHNELKKNLSDSMLTGEGRAKSHFIIDYWNNLYPDDPEKALAEYTKSQTRDLDWFINKFGPIEGPKRHTEKTEKWMKNYKKRNYSMISQELFNNVYALLEDKGDIYYATFDRPEKASYKNKEYHMKAGNSYYSIDFICLNRKKIIEYDGTYWHGKALKNPEKEILRDEYITSLGYDILRIPEKEHRTDPKKTLQKCLRFLAV